MGEFRWIILVSPDDKEGTVLVLEPNIHTAAKAYQKKIFAGGILTTMFGIENVHKELLIALNDNAKKLNS